MFPDIFTSGRGMPLNGKKKKRKKKHRREMRLRDKFAGAAP
jgi:hypothetical protein